MPSARRVLVVYDFLPHYRRGVFQMLQASDCLDVVFAAGPNSRDGTIPTVPLVELAKTQPLTNVWFGPFLWQRGLLSLVALCDYDDVILAGDAKFVSTWVSLIIARVRGKATYLWTIGWHRPDHPVKKQLRVLFYRLAHTLLLYGESAARIGVTSGFKRERIRVIGNSTEQNCLEGQDALTLPKLRYLVPEGEVVGAVIRLNAVKRLDALVRAAARLRENGRQISVLLAGGGPEAVSLTALAKRLGVPLVITGPLYSDDAIDLVYRRLSVTVVPEAAGLTVIQSLMHGVPVITCDDPFRQMPEYEAVRDGITGGLYRTGDTEDLARVIEQWLDMDAGHDVALKEVCMSEARDNWSSVAHARRIVSAIAERSPAPEASIATARARSRSAD